MAGKRRGTGKPLQRAAGCERRMANVREDLAAAADDAARIRIAAEYLRGALRRGPAPAGRIDEVVDELVAVGDRINRNVGEGESRDRR